MGLEGPLWGIGEGNGSLAASVEAKASGELDTQPGPYLCIGTNSLKLQLDKFKAEIRLLAEEVGG